jgi:N-acetylmuramoyl-L-alanine amidase
MASRSVVMMAITTGLSVVGLAFLAFGPLAPKGVASPSGFSASSGPKTIVPLTIYEVPSPNQDARPAGRAIDTIIIHDTETPGVSSARVIANYFCNPASQVSAHYIIGKDGTVLQCVSDDRRAWHAGPSHYKGRTHINDFALGIELVNGETGHDPFTNAQYASLIALSTDLVSRFHIPLDRITGHHQVSDFPDYKKDPAQNFDWNRYLSGLRLSLATKVVERLGPDGLPLPLAPIAATTQIMTVQKTN